MTYQIAQLDDIEVVSDGRCPWRPVRHHLGITAFGVNAWTAVNAGDRIINEHDEENEDEELYVVLDGRARFEIDGETVDAPSGSLVFVPPGRQAHRVRRGGRDDDPGHRRDAGQGVRGVGLGAVDADQRAVPERATTRRRPTGAAKSSRRTRSTVPRSTTWPAARASRDEPTTRSSTCAPAIAMSDRMREYARGDTDFDPIRDDPRFVELVGS